MLPLTPEALCDRLRLYVVIDPSHTDHGPVSLAEAAFRGGATAIQLRVKSMTDREHLELARAMRMAVPVDEVLLIVNDRLDIAMAAEADGVHLGVDDLQLEAARYVAGPDFVIGYSPETDAESQSASDRGASYLGIGPVFGTTSKSDAGPAIGLETLTRRQWLAALPVVGIGGIGAENAPSVVEAGACGVAVMSAVTSASDPELAVRELNEALSRHRTT